MMTINESTTVKQNPNMLTTPMDGEIVMMSIKHGKYYSIGKTGVAIWEEVGEGRTVQEIVSRLCERYEVDTDVCMRDVIAFVEQMASKEIVLVR
ncbi:MULTISPECIES: lasso peptide biosynthesis PqqD family chaperone [unclassified Exiguobacterium]|uniref:lasso peptide biosynthesis PqqD family chaperone n=1 Tax=unclassified Exiguobacterium TaxID=2644629 RepID=UPI001BEA311B|nr:MULTISPECIES: lasso peptide biosynthesis PqqD family chaperone [unclassified Exiguobacterium]